MQDSEARLIAEFEAAFGRIAAGRRIAGCAAGIVTPGQQALSWSSGLRRIGTPDQIRHDDRWHIGSITKSFTATTALRLAERGVVPGIDSPLAQILPRYADEMHPHWRKVTLAQLLGHVAGTQANLKWQRWLDFEGHLRSARLGAAREIWRNPPAHKPGKYLYSNAGYVLAGCVLEEVAQTPWEWLVRQELLNPLGLASAGFGAPPRPAPWGHSGTLWRKPVPPEDPWSDNPQIMGPAGRLHMNIKDLLRWGAAHLAMLKGRSPLLSRVSGSRMHAPGAGSYALGWVIAEPAAGVAARVHMHAGSNTIWTAHLALVPEREIALALAFNTGNIAQADRAALTLLRTVAGTGQHGLPLS